jgi:hypothetical protein
MPVITTEILANPKPAKHLNWVGVPIKDGEDYWGNKVNIDNPQNPSQQPHVGIPETLTGVPVSPQPKRDKRRTPMSQERRKALSEKVRAYWAAKRGKAP